MSNYQIKHDCDHFGGNSFPDLKNRKYKNEEVDFCIVGAGAAGGVLAYDLSKAGYSVVVIEAGPFWQPTRDFVSDELTMRTLAWNETRIVEGGNPLTLGSNISARGVGGGTVHFTGVMYRLHEGDFKTHSNEGVGVDWPITYQDLEPFYSKIENEVKVSGPLHFPWGAFHGPYPYPVRDPISANAQLFQKGCAKLGIESSIAPLGILSAPYEGRPPCINRGFCNQGCTPNAKFSTLVHHIPKAIANGAEILTDCFVNRILTDRNGDEVIGVEFNFNGENYKQQAKMVILSASVIETARLLLNSHTSIHPNGLSNSSGLVGKYIMSHTGHDIYSKFDQEVRFYKGSPIMAVTQDFYETDPKRDFVRGYSLHAHGARPLEMVTGIFEGEGYWGKDLREIMLDYNFYARITVVGEVLPHQDNQVTLSMEKDEHGVPIALVKYTLGDNENRLVAHAEKKSNDILEAVGGKPAFVIADTAHLMGGCRMGDDPEDSVVDKYCRSHDIHNLFICDSSVFPSSGASNPTETIMAIAARTANYIIDNH